MLNSVFRLGRRLDSSDLIQKWEGSPVVASEFFNESVTRSISGDAAFTVLGDGTLTGLVGLVGECSFSIDGSGEIEAVALMIGQADFTVTSTGAIGAIKAVTGLASFSVTGELKKRTRIRGVLVKKKYWA